MQFHKLIHLSILDINVNFECLLFQIMPSSEYENSHILGEAFFIGMGEGTYGHLVLMNARPLSCMYKNSCMICWDFLLPVHLLYIQ